jgi:uncharacterized membrane protein
MSTMLGFIALVAVSMHLAPQLTRRDVFFGVTVPVGFRDGPVARFVARRYAVEIWGLATIAAAIAVTSPMPFVSGSVLLVQTFGASFAFARAWSSVRRHAVVPAMVREAALTRRERLPGGVLAQAGPFLILCAAAVYVALNWEYVPERFPTHWNLAGKPDGWTAKSVRGVFRGFSLAAVACAMSLFTSYAVLHWTRLPRVAGVEGEQHRRVRRLNLLAMLGFAYMIATLVSWNTVVAMFAANPRELRLPLAFRVAPFALFIVGSIAIRVMRRNAADAQPPIGDTTPDSCWIFGRLYFNRRDPVLFVERRLGLGYTLNLGNPWSWLVIAVYVVAVLTLLSLVP